MFGYIKPSKGQLRICEYEAYQAVYCGMCHVLQREYGTVSRLFLNYDFVFLAMLLAPEEGAGDVACLKIGSFRPGRVFRAFHDAFPGVKNRARALIIDLRWNERGSSRMAAEFLSHLTRDTLLRGAVWRTRIYDAALASWGSDATPADTVGNARVKLAYEYYNDAAFSEPERSAYRFPRSREVLEVPTVILVNDATGSAAECFLALAASQPHMSTVGTPTSGCAGTVALYELLPGLQCGICTQEVRFSDGKEFVGLGIAPDVTVEDTLDDIRAGRDAALEKALELLGVE